MSAIGTINTISVSKLVLLILIFIPKITLIGVPGFVQGIRIEDLLILIIAINNYKDYLKNNNSYSFNIVIFYLVSIMLINYIIGIDQEFIIILRCIEYWVIYNFIYINHKYITQDIIIVFILINCGVAILQFLGMVGGFASFGYLASGHGYLGRPYGLMAGPWELGVTLTISLLILINFAIKNNVQIFLNILVFITLLLAATRSVLIGYIILNLYLFRKVFIKLRIIEFMLIILTIILFLLVGINYLNIRLDNINLIAIEIFNLNFSNLSLITNLDQSLVQRYSLWAANLNLWSSSIFNLLFGIGWYSLYVESLFIRLLTSFGLFGFFIIIFLYRKMKLSLFLFTFLAGITLDLFVSMKIFIFYCIYSSVIYNNDYENNNIRS